jgi:hypothetical protein
LPNTHSNNSHPDYLGYQPNRKVQLREQLGQTTMVCRKIGLFSLLSITNGDHKQQLVDRINQVVTYTRDVIVKSHLLITYFLYNKLNNGEIINQPTFTFQFFYSVIRQVIGGTINTNDTTNEHMADDIQQYGSNSCTNTTIQGE